MALHCPKKKKGVIFTLLGVSSLLHIRPTLTGSRLHITGIPLHIAGNTKSNFHVADSGQKLCLLWKYAIEFYCLAYNLPVISRWLAKMRGRRAPPTFSGHVRAGQLNVQCVFIFCYWRCSEPTKI